MNTEAKYDRNETSSAGFRLRNAREKLGLSQEAVAGRLCLKVSTVRDIEDNKTPSDLASMFLRGYIYSYAKLVRIPRDELPLILEQQEPTKTERIVTIKPSSLRKHRKKGESWLIAFTWMAFFIITGLTSARWWQNYNAQKKEITTITKFSSELHNVEYNSPELGLSLNVSRILDTKKSKTKANILKNSNAIISSPSQNNTDTTIMATKNATFSKQPLLSNQASISTSNNPNTLTMNFTADCWLEATDAVGKKLVSGLQLKNSTLNLTGQTPYRLIIGAPIAVNIQLDEKPINLNRFISANQVAHLTVNASQSSTQ